MFLCSIFYSDLSCRWRTREEKPWKGKKGLVCRCKRSMGKTLHSGLFGFFTEREVQRVETETDADAEAHAHAQEEEVGYTKKKKRTGTEIRVRIAWRCRAVFRCQLLLVGLLEVPMKPGRRECAGMHWECSASSGLSGLEGSRRYAAGVCRWGCG
jgi:hypothetical protein